jgi:hypothetical protein
MYIGATAGWPELRQSNVAALLLIQSQTFGHIVGGNIATDCFRPRLSHELLIATHRCGCQRSSEGETVCVRRARCGKQVFAPSWPQHAKG